MTRHLAPGSPPLNVGDKVPVAEPISDSSWEDLPDEEDTRDNLKKIAKARKGSRNVKHPE